MPPDLTFAVWKRADGLLFLPRESEDAEDGRGKRQYLVRIATDPDTGLPILLWLDRHRTGRRAARGEAKVPFEVPQHLTEFLRMVAELSNWDYNALLVALLGEAAPDEPE
jgi:hypothetical protein